ncbi:MAG: asparaginase [Brachymonas sp.]|nr:asparaginase [Brachymonas sp.]
MGTGGTIAGTAASSSDHTGYTAAQLSVQDLLKCVPGMQEALRGDALESEQVAQLDSKDMDFATMTRIAQRCAHHLAQADVRGIVITHGTDTLEETAYFLHLVLGNACAELITQKPVVLTCAMRPATSSEAQAGECCQVTQHGF